MTTPLDVLEAEVLSLPVAQRLRLLDRLFASLDADQDIEAAWVAEAQRRDEELDSGAAQGVPLEIVLARLNSQRS